MSGPLLEARGVTKRFPGVVALKDVNFDVRAGEIHALCGENGAGKSTLIKLLSGIHPSGSYEGELLVEGRRAEFSSVGDAQRAGVAAIAQELALVPALSVAENVRLGDWPGSGLVDWDEARRDAREWLARLGLDVDPDLPVERLGAGQRQLVEIAKALRKKARVLILDEPTAALAEAEARRLLELVRALRKEGIGIVYISHRLEEIFEIADRVTVLRDGSTVSTRQRADAGREVLIRDMVGREIGDLFPRRAPSLGPVRFEARGLSAAGGGGVKRLEDVSFSVRAGEVLGIGGLMGAGRTELLMHLFGAWGRRTGASFGSMRAKLAAKTPWDALAAGLALVTEDRRRHGLIIDQSVGFNLSLSTLAALMRGGLLDEQEEAVLNERDRADLRIKTPSLGSRVGGLSGGNQQKVLFGRARRSMPKVLLLDEPTRGVDVGAKVEIYEMINGLTEKGLAVILVSSELPELIGMSDRIVMMRNGRVMGEFTRAEATQERLIAAALGHGGGGMSGEKGTMNVRDWSETLALGAIVAVFAALSPEFLGARNLSMLAIELSITAILALGMLLVMLPGQIDLSAGSGVGLIGGVAAVLVTRQGWPAPLAMLAAALLAILIWNTMGRTIVTQKMPAFIITLGGLLVFKGLFWLVIRNATVPVSPAGAENLYARLTTTYLPRTMGWALAAAVAAVLLGGWARRAGRAKRAGVTYDSEVGFLKAFLGAQAAVLFVAITNAFRGVPLPAVLLAASAAAVFTLTEHTAFGRRLYAIGGNSEAALLAGIDVDKTVIVAYAIMGSAVALTGFMQTAYAGASTTTVGDLMELDAIAACVIGGTSLNGGRGNVRGVLFGALIMATLLNGMTLLAVSPEIKYVTRGLVLALAVWLDTRLSRTAR